ncbi:MAG TPA: hypothetical protein VK525_21465 [Candidatus Saccharimonadales bacterium]|nr:hypothetical protein [Candidatus Saccharimonadales bacterium]
MKIAVLLCAVLSAAVSVNAQQSVAVQMECHDPSLNYNFIGPDETLVNGMVCHVAKPVKAENVVAPVQPTPARQQAFAPKPTEATSAAAGTPAVATSSLPVPTGPVSTKIVAGSKVYITPVEGFEIYLAAAFDKKKVPLIAVADPSMADYVITGTSLDKKAGWAKIVFMGNIHSDNSASITMVDKKTGAIVFAYAVDKKSTLHGQQTTAEACAKHLKNEIEKDSK